MGVSDDYLAYVLDQYAAWGGVESRRMFGGAGLYRDGKMFGLIADDVVYLKADDTNRARFVDAGSGPFKPFPNRPTAMSYYEAPAHVLENAATLVEWSKASLAIQRAGAGKAKPKARRGRKSRQDEF